MGVPEIIDATKREADNYHILPPCDTHTISMSPQITPPPSFPPPPPRSSSFYLADEKAAQVTSDLTNYRRRNVTTSGMNGHGVEVTVHAGMIADPEINRNAASGSLMFK